MADAFVIKLNACGGISYSTYLGGNHIDGGDDIVVDSKGDVYVTGLTRSPNFPVHNAFKANLLVTPYNSPDAFVTKLNLNDVPSVVISEFRTKGTSGANDEFVELYNRTACAVDVSGWKIKRSDNAGSISTLVTITNGTSIPAYGHFLVTNNEANGYSGSVPGNQTFISDISDNGGIALTLPDDTIVDQVGLSTGSAFKEGTVLDPLTDSNNESYERKPGGLNGSTQDTNNNANDFQARALSDPQNLNSNPTPGLPSLAQSTLVYSTYLGGDSDEYGLGIAVDSIGSVYVTGATHSSNFPTLNAVQSLGNGDWDAFVTKLTPSGGLSFSTYLGGRYFDWADDIALDSAGNVFVTGVTQSFNFPTLNAFQASKGDNSEGFYDGFVSKLTANGSLSYSTYLGLMSGHIV